MKNKVENNRELSTERNKEKQRQRRIDNREAAFGETVFAETEGLETECLGAEFSEVEGAEAECKNKLRVVHYLNQFFGQLGGEEKADLPPRMQEGPVGPGQALNAELNEVAEIEATIICGDGYFNENIEAAADRVKEILRELKPDLVVAGPAFNAGRYGMACGAVAEIAAGLEIPVVSGIFPENPGYEMYRQYGYFIETSDSAAGMRKAVPEMAEFIKYFWETGGNPGRPEEAGYLPRGIRRNLFAEERGARRAVNMLLQKIRGEEFTSEYPMPSFDRVEPAAPLEDLSQARIALVTSGGIVPNGNPDRIESSSASKYGRYQIDDFDDLNETSHETAHGGYDPVFANEDADCVLPVDVLRDLEEEGRIGKLHEFYYSTVGNGTSVASARTFAREIAEELLEDGVQAVILTST